MLDELHRGVVYTAHQLQVSGYSKLRVHHGVEEHVADWLAGDATREPPGAVRAGLELRDEWNKMERMKVEQRNSEKGGRKKETERV